MTKLALILGAPKTGTTTATAICNADPRSHFLFEVDFSRPSHAPRNLEIIQNFADAFKLFGAPPAHDVGRKLGELLRANPGLEERFSAAFGVKLPGIRPALLDANKDLPVVFTVRNIRTWLCKNTNIETFRAKDRKNIVPTAVAYTKFFLKSFERDNILRLRLVDLFRDDGTYWPRMLSGFLGIDYDEIKNWWEKRDAIREEASYTTWPTRHESAFMKPQFFDTEATLAPHPFWDGILPIFDKYFSSPQGSFASTEIASDHARLDAMAKQFQMSLADGYTDFRSFKAGGLKSRETADSGEETVVRAKGLWTWQRLRETPEDED